MNSIISFLMSIMMLISGIFSSLGFNGFDSIIEALKKLLGEAEQISTAIELYDFNEENVRHDKKTGIDYVNNMLIVFFEENVDDEEREEIIDEVGGECVGRIDSVRQWQVEVESDDYASLEEKCELLRENSKVSDAFVETAGKLDSQTIPNDPWNGSDWDEANPDGHNWAPEAIRAPSAWSYDRYFNHIDIGVVDVGCYLEHPELAGHISVPESSSYDFAAVLNKEIHGTHVSSIIGAKANNELGLTGIIWDCDLYTVNCVPKAGQSFDSFTYCYAGVVACVQNGAKVVNASVGVSASVISTSLSNSTIKSHAKNAARYMSGLLESGYDFLVVQSSGNGNKNGVSIDATSNGMFCCIKDGNTGLSAEMDKAVNDRVIIVGAAEYLGNDSYQQCDFSNAGAGVDICAPGADIFGAGGASSYYYMSGTSQSAPQVTGVAGLVWSVNPELTGEEVKNIVCSSDNSRYVVADNTSSKHPLVNEYNMLDAKLCVEAAIETIPQADRTNLDIAVRIADGIDRTKYSAESLAVLDEALANVSYYKGQDETDEMTSAINKAISALDVEDSLVNFSLKGTIEAFEQDNDFRGKTLEYDIRGGYIGTGSTLRTYDSNGVPQDEIVFVVVADLSGDGVVTNYDKTLLRKLLRDSRIGYSQEVLRSADIDGNGEVNSADLDLLKQNLKQGIYK